MQAIVYRPATVNDIESIIKYRLLLLTELSGVQSEEDTAKLVSELQTYFTSAVANNTYISWIAFIDNEIAGIGGMTIWDKPGNFKHPVGKVGYILNMYTETQHRGKGIGTGIMKKLLITAKEIGVTKLELHATADGEAIYAKHDFEPPHNKFMELTL